MVEFRPSLTGSGQILGELGPYLTDLEPTLTELGPNLRNILRISRDSVPSVVTGGRTCGTTHARTPTSGRHRKIRAIVGRFRPNIGRTRPEFGVDSDPNLACIWQTSTGVVSTRSTLGDFGAERYLSNLAYRLGPKCVEGSRGALQEASLPLDARLVTPSVGLSGLVCRT